MLRCGRTIRIVLIHGESTRMSIRVSVALRDQFGGNRFNGNDATLTAARDLAPPLRRGLTRRHQACYRQPELTGPGGRFAVTGFPPIAVGSKCVHLAFICLLLGMGGGVMHRRSIP